MGKGNNAGRMLVLRQLFLLKYILSTLSQVYAGCVIILSSILNVIGNQPRQDISDPPMAVTVLLQGTRLSFITPRACSNFNPAKHKPAPPSENIGRVTGDLCLCHSLSKINTGISVMLLLFICQICCHIEGG